MENKYHRASAKCKCGNVIVSKWGGNFVECECGESFIDQERFDALYCRVGGDAQFIEQVCPQSCSNPEHKDNKKL